jgi:GWxTD domain-containing protein
MRLYLVLGWLIFSATALAQPLTGLNFNYWYDPQSEISAFGRVVNEEGRISLYFEFENKSTTSSISQYQLLGEQRESYTQRQGIPLTIDTLQFIKTGEKRSLHFSFDIPPKPWLAVFKIKHKVTQKSWTYFYPIEAIYPVDGWLEESEGRPVTQRFLSLGNSYRLKNKSNKKVTVSYYQNEFKPAYPPFAETGKSDQFLFYDSVFTLESEDVFKPVREGLYLFQTDTSSAKGFSYVAKDKAYPRYNRLQQLKEPMVFVTTQDEFNQLQSAAEDKARFDKVILDFTRDKERAKIFMRNYFRRVELANSYFSSYKEGWKTDRGMIYMIFGLPDEVSRNGGNEVWYYRALSTRFTFVKNGSVYDPYNYVLLRDNRFAESWYSTIDLWRKSRF